MHSSGMRTVRSSNRLSWEEGSASVHCKVIHISTYKPSTYKPTVSIDKDRPTQNKESGTHKERTAH